MGVLLSCADQCIVLRQTTNIQAITPDVHSMIKNKLGHVEITQQYNIYKMCRPLMFNTMTLNIYINLKQLNQIELSIINNVIKLICCSTNITTF